MSINLNDPRILSSSQACFIWGIHDSSLRKRIDQFPEGTIRRVGKTWLVTIEGMEKVFGERKRGFTEVELKGILKDVQNMLEKHKHEISGTQLFKLGVDFLIEKGYQTVIAQDIVRVAMKQMDSNLLFEIYQIDERRKQVVVNETNPLENGVAYHEEERITVYFEQLKSDDKIEMERLRLVTDEELPFYDISYIHIIYNGQKAQLLNFPVSQLPKIGWKEKVIDICKEKDIFIEHVVHPDRVSISR